MNTPKSSTVVVFPPAPALSLRQRIAAAAFIILLLLLYWVSLDLTEFDLGRLAEGVPQMVQWAQKAWPPDVNGMGLLLRRAGETVAIALIGSTIGCVLALPLSLLAARNINPNKPTQQATRFVLNALRGTDTLIFAIFFVIAVGLGPFAGVLGVALHTAGVVAKLWSEAFEGVDDGPMQAAMLTGATRVKTVSYALFPDVRPALISVALYSVEFNVRASTVLGLVGAGGIGQELKNSVDLLNFPRIFTLLIVIIVIVTAVDQLSAYIRKRLL